jgi:hypothetical protein
MKLAGSETCLLALTVQRVSSLRPVLNQAVLWRRTVGGTIVVSNASKASSLSGAVA